MTDKQKCKHDKVEVFTHQEGFDADSYSEEEITIYCAKCEELLYLGYDASDYFNS